jgi:hypothetical protein
MKLSESVALKGLGALRTSEPKMEGAMNKMLFSLALFATTSLLSGCTTIYSRIQGNFDVATTELNDYPVQIVAVDGAFQVENEARVEPGTHTLILTSKKPTHFRMREQKAFPFKVEPCMHYYLAARHAGRLTEDFDLIVRRVDPIGGCDIERAKRAAIN